MGAMKDWPSSALPYSYNYTHTIDMGAMKDWPSKRVKIQINYRYHPYTGQGILTELPKTTAMHTRTTITSFLSSRGI
jgi:hypothetical protein